MEDVNIPTPNPFITQWLVGPECRAMMWEGSEIMVALYREVVHKRTGLLAASARAETFIDRGRWHGRMVVVMPYAPSHEFGSGRTDPHDIQHAAHDLNTVLDMMATL